MRLCEICETNIDKHHPLRKVCDECQAEKKRALARRYWAKLKENQEPLYCKDCNTLLPDGIKRNTRRCEKCKIDRINELSRGAYYKRIKAQRAKPRYCIDCEVQLHKNTHFNTIRCEECRVLKRIERAKEQRLRKLDTKPPKKNFRKCRSDDCSNEVQVIKNRFYCDECRRKRANELARNYYDKTVKALQPKHRYCVDCKVELSKDSHINTRRCEECRIIKSRESSRKYHEQMLLKAPAKDVRTCQGEGCSEKFLVNRNRLYCEECAIKEKKKKNKIYAQKGKEIYRENRRLRVLQEIKEGNNFCRCGVKIHPKKNRCAECAGQTKEVIKNRKVPEYIAKSNQPKKPTCKTCPRTNLFSEGLCKACYAKQIDKDQSVWSDRFLLHKYKKIASKANLTVAQIERFIKRGKLVIPTKQSEVNSFFIKLSQIA